MEAYLSNLRRFYLLLFIITFITSCGPSPEEIARETSAAGTAIAAKWTATQSPTIASTITPTPTLTLTPTSAFTPAPSDTPASTPTPIGGGNGQILFSNQTKVEGQVSMLLSNIYIMNVDGSNLINLTNSNDPNIGYSGPRWSHDGSKIVFTSWDYQDQLKSIKQVIYIMDADGSNWQLISPPTKNQDQYIVEHRLYDMDPDWSPDNQKVVFSSNRHVIGEHSYFSYDSQLFTVDVNNYEITQLTTSEGPLYQPAWSPDGTQILFVSVSEGISGIYVMNSDGSNIGKLTDNSANNEFPRWSPDGNKIIFNSDRDGDNEIYTMDADGANIARITFDPANDIGASYSPDGMWIVFSSDRDGNDDIYRMKLDGSEITRLTDNNDINRFPVWKP